MKSKERIEGQRDRWLRIQERQKENRERKEMFKMMREKEESYERETEKEKQAREDFERRVKDLLDKLENQGS